MKSLSGATTTKSMNDIDNDDIDNAAAAPNHFYCPLTLEIMDHPLMTKAGHSFERSAILAWLRESGCHPLTRQPMGPRDLVNNRALESEIRAWRHQQRGNLGKEKKSHPHNSIACNESETEAASCSSSPSSDNDDSSSDEDNITGWMEDSFLFISTQDILDNLELRVMVQAQRQQASRREQSQQAANRTASAASATVAERPRAGRRRRFLLGNRRTSSSS